MTVTRRTLVAGGLGLGAAAVLAACTPDRPAGTGPTSGSTDPSAGGTPTTGATASTPPSNGDDPATWDELAAATTGALLLPGGAGWDAARVLRNPRYDDADPRAILQAAGTDDVAAGLAYARTTRTPVALRSGGHSYTGWSAGGAPGTDVPRSLVISTAGLTDIALSDDGSSVTVGPGAHLLDVYEQLASAGRAIGSGSCATVGIGGITLGGGVGVLVRSFGLTCDQLTGATLVTADGRAHDVSAHAEPDLFWACRGGGGGTIGVVTSMTFATRPAPPVLTFSIVFAWSDAAAVVRAWQDWAPEADRQLWSSLKLLGGSRHASGPVVTVSGTWTGEKSGADASVDGFIRATGATPVSHTATERDFGDAMRSYAGNGARVSEAATSSIGRSRMTAAQIRTLLGAVTTMSHTDGMTEGGVALDALGGAVGDVGATDTPVPWRDALWTAQWTATFADGTDPAPFDRAVRRARSAMRPAWGTDAYANYCDAALTDPTVYFGPNTSRLHRIAEQADPGGVFAQPHWV